MTVVEKLERALALAKELNFNDLQTRELMSVVLDLPITKIIQQGSPWSPNIIPWVFPNTPGPIWPILHDETIGPIGIGNIYPSGSCAVTISSHT